MKNSSSVYLAAGLTAFTVWGSLVLYWKALEHVPAFEILAHRMFWSLVTVSIVAAVTHNYAHIRAALRQKELMLRLSLAACVIAGNWLLYIWCVTHEHVVEASLGYFINPLLSVLLGRILLGEKMTRLQILAVAFAAIGVSYSVMAYGEFPLIGLTLACSFATYGYIKKKVNVSVIPGFFLETLPLFPLAAICLLWMGWQEGASGAHFFNYNINTQLLLMGTGAITALPLLLFAFASKGVQLSTMGLMQYIAPTINLLLGVFIFGESISAANRVMLICVWAALALYTWCNIHHYEKMRQSVRLENQS